MKRTGWPPGMMQDDSRELSRWLASRPGARRLAAVAAAALIGQNKGMTAKKHDEPKRPRGRPVVAEADRAVVGSLRLTRARWEKFHALGGAKWLGVKIDRAKIPGNGGTT